MLKAGYEDKGRRYETPRGTPQGGVVSPLLSNILLTPGRLGSDLSHSGRGAIGPGASNKDPRKTWRDAHSFIGCIFLVGWLNDCPRSARGLQPERHLSSKATFQIQ